MLRAAEELPTPTVYLVDRLPIPTGLGTDIHHLPDYRDEDRAGIAEIVELKAQLPTQTEELPLKFYQ